MDNIIDLIEMRKKHLYDSQSFKKSEKVKIAIHSKEYPMIVNLAKAIIT